ncbi:HAMP domain-containing histidine kinase [Altericroceibacterium xinjiangense]|uniref:HAMP domain-containing histidine kinase n=1 Tax=Altericroceibacterium xinjiangense TaxID=762261 RepID=UPI000F7D981B|nr:HAMP domain-containing histidine kinase [Altericroceibacterium xinjiangense]
MERAAGGEKGWGPLRHPFLSLALFPVLLGLTVAAIGELGLLRVGNGFLFDLAVARVSPEKPQVLVVRAEPEDAARITERLRGLGADGVMLVLPDASAPVPEGAVAGVQPDQHPRGEVWVLPAKPIGRVAAEIVPPGQRTTRRFLLWLLGEDGPIPTLEGIVTTGISSHPERLAGLPPGEIMPVLEGAQVLAGHLPPGSLTGLIVVVGPPAFQDAERYRVSTLPGAPMVSAAEFHARALQSVLTERTVIAIRGLPSAVLLVLFALLAGAIGGLAPLRRQVPGIVLAGALAVAGGMALIGTAGLLLPLVEIILIALVLALRAAFRKQAAIRRKLLLLGDRSAAQLRSPHRIPDEERWAEFFSAAARLTGVENSLVLSESAEGAFHPLAVFGAPLHESGSPEGSLARSRDFDRADAVPGAPVIASGIGSRGDVQVVRLNSRGEAGLYWVFTTPQASAERDHVQAAAGRLARHALERLDRARPHADWQEPEDRLDRALSGIITRNHEVARAFAGLQAAIILFDPAGVPLQANESMERLLQKAGLSLSRTTPVDFAVAAAGLEMEDARRTLGYLVRHGGQARLGTRTQIGGRHYTVRAARIEGDLLFEVNDVTELERLTRIEAELAGEIDAKLRNDLEAITLATRLAADERFAPERRTRALQMIAQAAQRAGGTLRSLDHLVESSLFENETRAYPLNPRSALDRALARIGPDAERAGAHVRVHQPELVSLVLAEPDQLDCLIEAMLQIIVSDSSRGSEIAVDLIERKESSEIAMQGGFGLPAARFADSLHAPQQDHRSPFRILQRAMRQLPAWGAELTAQSDVGQGYRFVLRLRKT